MKFRYSQWTPESATDEQRLQQMVSLFSYLVVQTSGDVQEALEWLKQLAEEYGLFDESMTMDDLIDKMREMGIIEEATEGLSLTTKGVQRIRQDALREIFTSLKKAPPGAHETPYIGRGVERQSETRKFTFGDHPTDIDLTSTLSNAFRRDGIDDFTLKEEDLEVYESEHQTTCATVVLLDMSGSMDRYGKFYHAKKVALALQGLIRGRYPEDSIKFIGFYTYASPLTERALLHAAPKPVSIFDSRVFLRVPLDNPPDFVPEHFTNIQAGLRFARNHLQKQAAANKQIICITDGEPTAHLEQRELVLVYPPSERTAKHTLTEVQACTQAGIQISTFALIEDYFYTGLVNFVDQMARASRGLAVYCHAGELGRCVLEGFVRGRHTRKQMG